MKRFLKTATGLLALAVLVVVLVLTFGGQKKPTEPLPEVVELASPTASRPTRLPTKQPTQSAYPAPAVAGAELPSSYPSPPTAVPTSPPYPTPMQPTATATPAPGKWLASNIQIVGQKEFTVPDRLFKEGRSGFFRPVFSPDNRRLLIEFNPGKYLEWKEKGGVALLPLTELWLIASLDQPELEMRRLVENATGGAWSPDGSQIAYLSITSEPQFELWVMDGKGNQNKLAKNVVGTLAMWRGHKHLLFVDKESYLLHQVSLDGAISEPLLPIPVFGDGRAYSISPSGEKVVVATAWDKALLFFLSKGTSFELPLVAEKGIERTVGRWAWSHDERYFAYFTAHEILVIIETETGKEINHSPIGDGFLAWSPDAEAILISRTDRGHSTLNIINRDTLDSGRQLLTENQTIIGITWSSDGHRLLQHTEIQKLPYLIELKLIR